jgi:hypothetical protein
MRRTLAALSAAALTATLGTVVGATVSTAGATVSTAGAVEAADAPFTLWSSDRAIGYKIPGRAKAWADLGLRLVGGPDGFEVRSQRPDYDSGIVTTWTSGAATGTLPQGTQRSFRSLRNLLTVDYRTLDGDLALRRKVSPCLNDWVSERVDPDAEPRNRYPWGCPWNPYTVGSVQGVQAGWATALPTGRVALGTGRYDVTVKVSRVWARSLGLAPGDVDRTLRLVIKRFTEEDGHDHAYRQQAAQRERPASTTPRAAASEPTALSAGTTGPRPDLRSLPAFGIELNGKGTHLRFSANVWNGGDSPLVVDGFRRPDEDVMDAYQYFFDANGDQVGYEQVGEMSYHEANHQHWHFEDFARYRLLNADRSEATRSGKVSFCLANTDAVDYTVPGADWHPETTDLNTACGESSSLSIREVLSSGSGDTYAQYRAGQAFRISNLANGWYWIAVEANPDGNLLEHDQTNNISYRKVWIGGTPEERRIKVPQVGVVEEKMPNYWW